MKGIKVYHYALLYYDCSIRVYQSFTPISHQCFLNIYFTPFYYTGIMLNASMTHNRRVPNTDIIYYKLCKLTRALKSECI